MTWDLGVRWHLEVLEPRNVDLDPLTLAFVRDQHLRVTNGTAEDTYLTTLIKTSYRMAERTTRRALQTQELALVLDRFPYEIRLPRPPVQSIDSIVYVDENGVEQTLDPALYQATNVNADLSLERQPPAILRPAYDETWPTTRRVFEAVTISYTCGYVDEAIPEDIEHGRLLVIGEFYKQRSESVHAINQNPALIRARDLWLQYRVHA